MNTRLLKKWLVGAWCAAVIATAIVLPVPIYFTTLRSFQYHNDFKWIAMALHQYHDHYGSFPLVAVRDDHHEPVHSWRTLIQPELASIAKTSDQFAAYDFSQLWNSPVNAESQRNHRFGRHPYQILAVVGPHAAWDESTVRKISDFKDGTSNTILAIALRGTGTAWNEPRDLVFDGQDLLLNGGPVELDGDLYVMTADGSVRYAKGMPWETLRPMLTIDGGENVNW